MARMMTVAAMPESDADRDLRERVRARGGLVNQADIARRIGRSSTRVGTLVKEAGFPSPVGRVAGRPVWSWAQVEEYRREQATVGGAARRLAEGKR